MVHHVVLWKFQDSAGGATKSDNLTKARDLLEALVGKIPGIRSMIVGIDCVHSVQSYDLALEATFASMADLQAYQDHPAHQEVVQFLRSVHCGRVVVDFEA